MTRIEARPTVARVLGKVFIQVFLFVAKIVDTTLHRLEVSGLCRGQFHLHPVRGDAMKVFVIVLIGLGESPLVLGLPTQLQTGFPANSR